ncbi:MAG: hypothetical protein PVI89_13370, partial [Desulfobacteraceae bacterium]
NVTQITKIVTYVIVSVLRLLILLTKMTDEQLAPNLLFLLVYCRLVCSKRKASVGNDGHNLVLGMARP